MISVGMSYGDGYDMRTARTAMRALNAMSKGDEGVCEKT